MPTEKEVLNEFASKTLNLDTDGVASLYNEDGTVKDDALQVLLDKHAEKIQSLKPDTKKIFDDGYKKGQSESLSKFEKEAKQKHGISSDKQGLELIEDIVAKYKIDHPDDPDKIKKSKFYLDAVEEFNTKSKELENNYNSQLEAYKKTVEKERLFGSVSEKALIIFEGLDPILSEDPARAANQRRVFLNELGNVDYTIREGAVVLLDKEGNDLTDRLGNRVNFEDYVKEVAEKYFDFNIADPKSAPNHPQRGNQNSTVFIITSEEQYAELRLTVKPEDKAKLVEAYNKFRKFKK
jgi:hypothetical protein